MAGTCHYNTKGLYTRYDKNHKERDKLDYYSTPTEEVYNILNTLDIDFSNSVILEPCAGEGHMAAAIINYIEDKEMENVTLTCTDVYQRYSKFQGVTISGGLKIDFLANEYTDSLNEILPNTKIDWIIMNPPYSIIEPFVIRALEIAQKGVIMLGRIQFLEG